MSFINSKRNPMEVGANVLNEKGTKEKGHGFLTIQIGKQRAWAIITQKVIFHLLTKGQVSVLKDRLPKGLQLVEKRCGAVKRMALEGPELAVQQALEVL